MAMAILLIIAVLVVLLLTFQHRLIYFPRPYSDRESAILARVAIPLVFTTSQGRQCAYFIPSQDPVPRRVWALFCGNGSVAADWLELVQAHHRQDAFLLVDYPGYGASEGVASPATITENASVAAELVRGQLPEDTAFAWGAMGHSLGCAAALQFAVKFRAARVILVSPFTTMRAMAQRQVGWPLSLLLRHRFDNVATLDALAGQSPRPRVTIFHGLRDGFIPPAMGRELAAAHPKLATFVSIKATDHNNVVALAAPELLRALGE